MDKIWTMVFKQAISVQGRMFYEERRRCHHSECKTCNLFETIKVLNTDFKSQEIRLCTLFAVLKTIKPINDE